MKRLRILLASFGLLFALGAPLAIGATASAQVCTDNPDCIQILPCNNDLAVTKQVKVPGGSFVDAGDAASAPNVHVGDTVQWLIGVTKNLQGACEGTPNLHGNIVLHDTLPTGVTFVSASPGAGTYDESTSDWSFTSLAFSSTTTIYLLITTTANHVGSFENVAALSKVDVNIPDSENQETVDYALGVEDPYFYQKDQVTSNNSADAWVNIQVTPQVLGESTTTPQVLGLTNTGTGTLAQSILAGMFIVSALVVISWGTIFKKRAHFKIKD